MLNVNFSSHIERYSDLVLYLLLSKKKHTFAVLCTQYDTNFAKKGNIVKKCQYSVKYDISLISKYLPYMNTASRQKAIATNDTASASYVV